LRRRAQKSGEAAAAQHLDDFIVDLLDLYPAGCWTPQPVSALAAEPTQDIGRLPRHPAGAGSDSISGSYAPMDYGHVKDGSNLDVIAGVRVHQHAPYKPPVGGACGARCSRKV
jgi:hypothetical protein